MCGGVRICPQLRCFAACSGFHIDVSLQDTAQLTHDTVHLTPHPIRPPSGNGRVGGEVRSYPQLRCSAACSGFHIDVSLQDTAQLRHDTVQHIHDIANLSSPPYVPRRGTDYQKPTASCEAAPLWGIANLPSPYRFRVAGPTIRNPLQAAKQRRCGYKQTSHLPIGSATRDRLSETHCKLLSSAAVGISKPPISP